MLGLVPAFSGNMGMGRRHGGSTTWCARSSGRLRVLEGCMQDESYRWLRDQYCWCKGWDEVRHDGACIQYDPSPYALVCFVLDARSDLEAIRHENPSDFTEHVHRHCSSACESPPFHERDRHHETTTTAHLARRIWRTTAQSTTS